MLYSLINKHYKFAYIYNVFLNRYIRASHLNGEFKLCGSCVLKKYKIEILKIK